MSRFRELLKEHFDRGIVVHIDNGCIEELLEECDTLGFRWGARGATEFIPDVSDGNTCVFCEPSTLRLGYGRRTFFDRLQEEYGDIYPLSKLGVAYCSDCLVDYESLIRVLCHPFD